jgi:hypothetical protein
VIEFEPLFDPSKRVPFKEPELDAIPKFGSILYTIWNTSGQFIYVGIGGIRGQRAQDRNPRSRILQHWQGMRSGDQFCIYVQDHFVLPALVGSPYFPQNGQIDRLVRQYIHQHLAYAYIIDQSDDGNKRVRDYERQIQQGAWRGLKPLLNPL